MSSKMTLKRIGEFYNTAHLIRPVEPSVVRDYAKLMEAGAVFPPLKLGIYKGMEGGKEKVIVDGVHIFKAAALAGIKKLDVEVETYENLPNVLAAQFNANASHGFRLTVQQRDARIRMLVEVYGWSKKVVAHAVGLHYSSVSKIVKGTQNVSGTGKPGPKKGQRIAPVVAHALPPKTFFRSVKNICLTVSKPQSKLGIITALRDPKTVKDIPKAIAMFEEVVDEFQQLIKLAKQAEKVMGEDEKEAA